MEKKLREHVVELWHRYFSGAELPIGFYYTESWKKVQARLEIEG